MFSNFAIIIVKKCALNLEKEVFLMNTDETITIYDVAREAGVSMATVSRVVNGNKKRKRKHPKKSARSH